MLGPNTSWNDMILMGDDDDCRPMPSVILPSAPKASLEPEFNPDDVPESAPFLGYVTNMHFEITEDMIKNHYKQFKVCYCCFFEEKMIISNFIFFL